MLTVMAMMLSRSILKQYRTNNSYSKNIFSFYKNKNGNGIISTSYSTNGSSNYSSNELIIDSATTAPMKHTDARSNSSSPTSILAPSKIFGHFLMHIPKSGTSYAFHTLGQLLYPTPEWQNLYKLNKHFRSCDEATKPLNQFRIFREHYKGTPCTLWMSEQPFSPVPERVYAIVRDPRSHYTLSMYFHCLESFDHRRYAYKMPKSLDTWLDACVDAKNDTNKQMENQNLFACYNPRLNFQTRWIGYNFLRKNNNSADIYYNEEDGNTAMTNNTGKQQHKQYMYSEKDLKDRYMVLGDHAQMDKSVCMIFIHYTGWVPKRCVCTTSSTKGMNHLEANNATVNLNTTGNHFGHGVTHHGSLFQTTPSQDKKIAILRDLDFPLYEKSREIFREQVRIVEDKYNITICDKLLE